MLYPQSVFPYSEFSNFQVYIDGFIPSFKFTSEDNFARIESKVNLTKKSCKLIIFIVFNEIGCIFFYFYLPDSYSLFTSSISRIFMKKTEQYVWNHFNLQLL